MSLGKRLIETAGTPPVEDAFNVVTYAGNGSTSNFISTGFTCDLVWIKSYDSTDYHNIIDSSRNAGCFLNSNTTTGEDCNSAHAQVATGGFNTKSNPNNSARNYVAWCWRANEGTTSSNTNGSITSTVQANTDAGFSIVKWTGNQSNATIGHGLNSAPEIIIAKGLYNQNWAVYHKDAGATYWLQLNSTNSKLDEAIWQDTIPTSSVFSVNGNVVINKSGDTSIAYCFHSVDGYSKIGAFTGNGSCDTSNAIQNCGFKPDYVLLKNATDGGHWGIFDSARGGTGQNNKQLTAEGTGAQYTGLDGCDYVKFENTGFRVTTGNSAYNGSGKTIIYMAFRIAS